MTATAPASSGAPAKVLRVFEEAADLKVTGHSWAVIAVKLARAERTLRRWRQRYPEDFAKLMVEAYEDALQRVGGGALVALSHSVADKKDSHHWRSSQFLYGRLFQLTLTLIKLRLQGRTQPAPTLGKFWKDAIQDIERMTEEEVANAILRAVKTIRPDHVAAAVGATSPPSAP